MSNFNCPRRVQGLPTPEDYWTPDDTCSYCGSLHPDVALARLKNQDVTLSVTDKTYKVYLLNAGGPAFRKSFMGMNGFSTQASQTAKFYYPHWSENQQIEFVGMLNAKMVHFTNDVYFTHWPYFLGPKHHVKPR